MILTTTLKALTAGTMLLLTASHGSIFDSRIFEPEKMPASLNWGDVPEPSEISVTTSDGLILKGYRWKPRCKSHVALVFFHGNSGNRFDAANLAAPLRRDDVDLIVASYRGYGDNPGQPDEEGLYADAEAFVKQAKADRPDKVFLFGYSLGGAVALNATTRVRVNGIATLGTFTDLRSAAPRLARAFIPYEFDNLKIAKSINTPWLLMHGTKDEVVPVKHAQRLADAAGNKAVFVRLQGAPHRILLDQIAQRIWTQLGSMSLSDSEDNVSPSTEIQPADSQWNYLARDPQCDRILS
ncbi:alpha/beta hydrolase [Novosphingopyxis sp.]|uniref:alpha/beta hydrolase n=1 Tax=Novosphingopyxis sp. TaxID=2709690 RepID=UPI003B5CBE3C